MPPASSVPTTMNSSSFRNTSVRARAPIPCRVCTQPHPLYKCTIFRRMPLERRLRAVAYHRYCYNCLRPDHVSKNCPVPQNCRYCNNRHHSVLHASKRKPHSTTRAPPKPHTAMVPRGIFSVPPSRVLPTAILPISRTMSLSPTLIVHLCLPHASIPVRALFDPCCQTSQICASLIEHLCWPTTKVNDIRHADFLM